MKQLATTRERARSSDLESANGLDSTAVVRPRARGEPRRHATSDGLTGASAGSVRAYRPNSVTVAAVFTER